MVALEHLEQGDLTLAELTARMAEYLDVEADDLFNGQVSSLVHKFDELGLIEPCQPPQ